MANPDINLTIGAPYAVAPSVIKDQVSLTWDATTRSGDIYVVFYSTDGFSTFSKAGTLEAGDTGYPVPTIPPTITTSTFIWTIFSSLLGRRIYFKVQTDAATLISGFSNEAFIPSSNLIWPNTLPGPLISDFQESEADLTVATQTDVGPPKVRLRATAGIRIIQLGFIMNVEQLNTFTTFYRNLTRYGANRWFIQHPRTKLDIEVLFRPGEPPKWSAVSHNLWKVQFSIYEVVD